MAFVLHPEPRQRNATAAAFRTAARPRVAVALRELEAAIETRRRLDDENLALVFERPLQVFEVLGDVVFPNADEPRQVTGCDRPV
jgi:hypothetical protein